MKLNNETLSSSPKPLLLLLLAVFLLGTLIFLPALSYDFVIDDYLLIKDNPQIKTPASVGRLLFSDFHLGKDLKFYRPLVMMSFALDYSLFQESPRGYHFVNILLHGFISALAAFLAWRLFQNFFAALAAGALFALHPVHPEAVVWISGRTDLLLTLFSLLSLLALLNRGGGKYRILSLRVFSLLFFFLALLSKETAVAILAPIAILIWQTSPPEQKRLGAVSLKVLPHALMLILYLGLWYAVMKGADMSFPLATFRQNSPLALGEIFRSYLLFLIFPPQQASYFHLFPGSPAVDAKLIITLVVIGFLLAAVVYVIYHYRETMLFFALVILPCLFSLAYSMFHPIVMLDRYLYLPTVGLALLAGWFFWRIPSGAKKWAGVGLVLILVAYGGATLWRTPLWKNGVVLFEAFKKEDPSSYAIRNFLGRNYMAENRLSEAYRELSEAVRLNPYEPTNRISLGHLYLRLGQPDKAREEFSEILKIDPNLDSAWEGLGSAYMQEGNYEAALQCFDRAVALDPKRGSTFDSLYKQAVRAKRKS